MSIGDPITRLNAALEGRYRIERQLGEGGMAMVYLAHDVRHGRNVALKVLKPELAAVVGAERFLAEIRTTANLQHPHILPLFDSGEADSFLFYVMPYIEGESLRDRLDRERQLPVDEAVRIATNLVEALDYAHRRGVIHRDIKPANILLQDGKPVVSDFGIALAVGAAGGSRLTETGLSLGTPLYMSPEQATGDQRVGPPTDIWAAGCVLYEMLVGEAPYQGGTPQAILGRIVTGDPRPLREQRVTVPSHVEATVATALQKVPADRFRTGADFARALSDPAFGYRGARARHDRRTSSAVAVMTALLLGAALGWGLRSGVGGPESGVPGGRQVVEYTIPSWDVGVLNQSVALSPDGELVAQGGAGRPLALRSVRRSEREPRTILPEVLVGQSFFSPDGSRLGYLTGIDIRTAPVAGGQSERIASLEGFRNAGGAWTDGGYIVFATLVGLFRVPEDGGAIDALAEPDSAAGELMYGWPEAIPGSDWVLFTILPVLGPTQRARDATSSIGAVNVQSGEKKIVLRGGSSPRITGTGHLVYSSGETLYVVAFDPMAAEVRGEAVDTGVTGIEMVRGAVADYDVSASGTLLYQPPGEPLRELVWVDRAGRAEVVSGWGARPIQFFRLSPQGTEVAGDLFASGGRSVHVWDLVQERMRRVSEPANEASFAVWSRRGDTIYFTTERVNPVDTSVTMDVFKRASNGTGTEQPVYQGADEQWVHSVSPDGSLILVNQRNPAAGNDYDLVTITTSEPTRLDTLLATASVEAQAVIHPLGEHVAYVSKAEGDFEVYVGRLSSMETERWRVSVDGGGHPVWSPDGDELYFRDPSGAVFAARVRVTPDVSVDRPTRLFANPGGSFTIFPSGTAFEMSPRDGRFLMRREIPADTRLRVVLNWVPEVLADMDAR